MKLHPSVLARAPWSISKANVLDLCGAQFFYKYVLKKKETAKSGQSKVGVAAHSVLEGALLDRAANLEVQLDKAVIKENLTPTEEAEVRARLPAIADFRVRIAEFKTSKDVKEELIEKKLAMTCDFAGCAYDDKNVLVRGVVDYAMITSQGCMIIIDHKSGKKKPIGEHLTQFYTYMLLAMANYDISTVQCAINYIGAPRLDWGLRHNGQPGAWTRAEVELYVRPWLEHYLNKSVSKLVLIDEESYAEPEPGWACGYCGYLDQCEPGRDTMQARLAKRTKRTDNV